MLSKIVENWLPNVGELTFTVPFCQLLLRQGKRVIHISSQGPMEQGKDIIAIDGEGRVHCYQLKCGQITSNSWREIKGEIDELVELPPVHPSLPGEVFEWDAYLVTNGNIANPAVRTIKDYSDAKAGAGHRPLKTIVAGELARDFTDCFGGFLPVEITDLQVFLELYNQPGDESLDCGKFKQYFEVFFAGHSSGSRQKKSEAIQASLILTSYLMTYKYAAGNRLDIIKAHVLLLVSIYQFAEANGLKPSLYRGTERLAYGAIELEFRQLIDELAEHSNNFVEAKYGLLSEAVTYKLRCTDLLGYVASYLNYCRILRKNPHRAGEIGAIMEKLEAGKVLAGEYAVPLLVNACFTAWASGREQEANDRLCGLLGGILVASLQQRGLPSPYYAAAEAAEWQIGIAGDDVDEDFRFKSYSLQTILLLLARSTQRDFLARNWKLISTHSMIELVPDDPADYLAWRFSNGTQVDRFPGAPQSWARLVADAQTDHLASLPPVLRDRRHFLPLFVNAMPQRFNHKVALTLLDAIVSAPD
ncbi:hypothetical protein KDK95_09980 [Actinospica sp. MGRD01-02]|uniref:Uncharacterized protein n=1 Tax=Actinospica acidithermotolerans TaxID=2828514 RepID=A0A941IIZ2_9ACTN|nr:hypothetical protein [Actinospica acidithermotolerans]MBR7826633.1 hypothetical protein [Actinospica acidithermotolerans]